VRYKIGRFLQIVGMIMLPMAMAGNLVPDAPVTPGTMLVLTAIGCGIFYLGWVLQGSDKGKSG
jgi:hypothetical protein